MSDISSRIADLSPEKRELLLRRLSQEKKVKKPTSQPISRVARDTDTFPLSYAQERLWFLDQLDPGTRVYNIPQVIRLKGAADIPALEKSLNQIVARHETLRTNFSVVDGKPVQIISPARPFSLIVEDLRDMSARKKVFEVNRLGEREAQWSFDLRQGWLFRATLLILDDQDFIFLLTMHHIISDAWSVGIFARELIAFYSAFTARVPASLPPLPIQYIDFAHWQQQHLQGERLEGQLAYWKDQLSGELPNLDLPLDGPRPPIQTYTGDQKSLRLSAQLSAKLKQLSREETATLFMILLAAFKLLLHRYTGQTDIIVGSPIAGRNRAEIENLIGFFLNTLVLRTGLSGDLTFRELLQRVRAMTVEAYAHQDVPFERLLIELQPERDLSRTPLFQVFFNMLNVTLGAIDLPGLTVEPLSTPDVGSKFDLTMYIEEDEQEINLLLVYNADLFSSERMAELLTQYESLLVQVTDKPDARLAGYSLLTARSKADLPDPCQPLSDEWHGAVHQALTRQAQRVPQNIALDDGLETWTYRELEERANGLARHLQVSGVKKGDVVAIYGHRSASLVWAVLSTLKAGAAFLILDPAYPPARLIDYLQLAQPRAWLQIEAAGSPALDLQTYLGNQPFAARLTLPPGTAAAANGPWLEQPSDPPQIEIGPDDLAYLSFTSGSMGKPKGVMGRHGPLSHFLPWQQRTFELTENDRFSMLSGLAHDPLQRDMFTALWVGARLCIPNPDKIGLSGWLSGWLKAQDVTITHLTPAMGQLITDPAALEQPEAIERLRFAFFVGDSLTRRDVNRLCGLAPNLQVVNFYGSTETQRAVGHYFVPSNETLAESETKTSESTADYRTKEVIPLGKGLPSVQLLILNSAGKMAGIGEAGEVYVRSPHLALGYLDDEEQTRARFITNPFTGLAGDRLYRTGDLGGYLPDGNVEFMGRADNQVQVRGFRVELGEIEAVLGQHPAVHEAVVLVHTDERTRSSQLAAYIVSVSEQEAPTAAEMRHFLEQRLPRHMIPAAFAPLAQLPLTPNGKVDRKALPVPTFSGGASSETYVAPRDEMEFQLVNIWEQVLGVKPIGVKDNFFDLGGHSLLAIRLAAQIERLFNRKLPLASLFRASTVEQLAYVLRQENWSLSWSSLVPVRPVGSKPPLFFVHGGGGHVLFYHNLARYLEPDQPLYGLQRRELGGPYLRQTKIEDMAAHYIQEMRSLQPEGPYYIGGYCVGGTIAFEMAHQLRRAGQDVALVALLAAGYPPGINRPVSHYAHRVTEYMQYRIPFRFLLLTFLRKLRRLPKKIRLRLARTRYLDYFFTDEDGINRRMKLHYQAEVYPGQLTLIETSNRTLVPWASLTTDEIQYTVIPGTHLSMFREPYVQELARSLTSFLEQE